MSPLMSSREAADDHLHPAARPATLPRGDACL